MDNLSFVKRFIAGTKEKCIQWYDTKGTVYSAPLSASEGFYTLKSKNSIIIMRSNNDNYIMVIRDAAGTEVYRIDEGNLLYDADGEMIERCSYDDEYALSRLFRLAERSAKKIDSLLEELTKDLPAEDDDDDLPF